MQLRDYQHKAVDDSRELIRRGCRRVLLVAPTGSGKTVIAAHIIRSAAERFRRVIFFAHHRELVEQCGKKLHDFGVDFGIIMAGEFVQLAFEVQVASIDTFRARAMNKDRMPWPHADLIVIDEAHRSLGATYLKVIERYCAERNAVLLGLTATPVRSDKRGMGHVYDGMVQCPQIGELIRLGHLVPERTFCPTIPDLTGVKVVRGDFDQAMLEERMNKRALVGNIVEHWFRHASNRKTVVFASGVKHSMALRDEFKQYIDRVAHIDGSTPLTTRTEMIKDLHSGKLQVITNFNVLTEGFDDPGLSAAVIGRPTKNIGVWLQMGGRVMRTDEASGKKDSLIFDHSGNTYVHGYLSDDQDWSLEEGNALKQSERERRFDERDPITCVKCARTYTGQMQCPHCGHIPIRRGKRVETRHGELVELRSAKRRSAKKKQWTTEEKELWCRMLRGYAEEMEYQLAWVGHNYRKKIKEPWVGPLPPSMPPSHEVRSWCKGMAIRYAKGREKANQRTGTG